MRLTENLAAAVRSRGRRAAEPVVSRRRVGAVEGPHAYRPDAAAHAAGVPVRGAVLEGHLRRSSLGPRVGDAGDARRDHARRDGRVSPDAVRARSRAHRVCRRHLACRGAQAGRDEARGVEEGGHAEADGDAAAGAGAGQGVSRRPSELGADEPHGRHAVDDADRSGLRAADGGEPCARRHDGTALPASARREGLHLRHRQRLLGAATSAASGRRRPTCGRR